MGSLRGLDKEEERGRSPPVYDVNIRVEEEHGTRGLSREGSHLPSACPDRSEAPVNAPSESGSGGPASTLLLPFDRCLALIWAILQPRTMDTVFIYWDNSNIFVSAKEVAVQREGEGARSRVRIHFRHLLELVRAGRPVEKALAVGCTGSGFLDKWTA